MTELNNLVTDYLAWETSKHFIQSFQDSNRTPTDRLKSGALEVKEWYENNLSKRGKLKIIEFQKPNFARLLDEHNWEIEAYPVAELGTVLPVTGDLPPEVVQRSLPHVRDYVEEQIRVDGWDSRSIELIDYYKNIPDIINEFPPVVVEPGKIQRTNEKMQAYYGRGDWAVTNTEGYIEDGNHRALAALVESGSTDIRCYVGSKKAGISFSRLFWPDIPSVSLPPKLK